MSRGCDHITLKIVAIAFWIICLWQLTLRAQNTSQLEHRLFDANQLPKADSSLSPAATPNPHWRVFLLTAEVPMGERITDLVKVIAWADNLGGQRLMVERAGLRAGPEKTLRTTFYRTDGSQLQLDPNGTQPAYRFQAGPGKWLSETFIYDLKGIDLSTLDEIQLQLNFAKSKRIKLTAQKAAGTKN